MILIFRGHIRDSFKTKELYNLTKKLYNVFPDLKIFIHTWNIFANNISWREISYNSQPVNETIIQGYFDDLKHLIHHVIIDDDSKIQLIGNLCGNIGNGPMPIVGWKNYWYGKHKIIDFMINTTDIDETEMVVNCRFDIMKNSNNFNEKTIMDFILNHRNQHFTKNVFLFNDERHYGIDNIYIGNINTQHKLSTKFFYELDEILKKNKSTINQEFLVYRINYMLFYYTNVILHDTRVKYKRSPSHNYSKSLLSAL